MLSVAPRPISTSCVPRLATALLLVLLAHLALMASPLHAEMTDPGPEASAGGVAATDGTLDPSPRASETCLASYADCLQAWTAPAQPSVHALMSPLLAGGVRLLLDHARWPGLLPRAHGPPEPADAQALLQVFRI